MIQLPRTLFCSDFHLCGSPKEHPQIVSFFQHPPGVPQAVVILGDLFECWWGDHHTSRDYHEWEKILASIPATCYFIPGNRDFLIGREFCRRTNMTPLQSGTVVQIGNTKIALFHGDEPGLQDWPYQLWRKIARSRVAQALYVTLPETARRRIAIGVRGMKSAKERTFKELPIHIEKWLEQCAQLPDAIINGHLHFPLVQDYELGITRYQLGCWDEGAHSFMIFDPSGAIVHDHSRPVLKRSISTQ